MRWACAGILALVLIGVAQSVLAGPWAFAMPGAARTAGASHASTIALP